LIDVFRRGAVQCFVTPILRSLHWLKINERIEYKPLSHRLSLPLPFTPDITLISFTDPFLQSHSYSFRTAFMDFKFLTCTELKGYWLLF